MGSLVAVFTRVVRDVVGESKCKQENDRLQKAPTVRASCVVKAGISQDGKECQWMAFL